MAILVVAEHSNNALAPMTLNVVSAAMQIGAQVHVLVAGEGMAGIAEQAARIVGVDKVLLADNPAYTHSLAENIAPLVVSVARDYSHVLAGASSNGKNCMPRVAALLDVEQISEIIAVDADDTFKRPIYAGNAIATVQSSSPIKVITVRTTAFEPTTMGDSAVLIETINASFDSRVSSFVTQQLAVSERPELTTAKRVVSGGRGMQKGENFKHLYCLADKLGAGVGASRAAVDAGFVANDLQVGQTGKIVAPELYVAVGISGAIQHLAGMKDSRVIVAINKDEEAPIFQVADYGLVADLFEAVPELERML